MLESVVRSMPWTTEFKVDHTKRTVHLVANMSDDDAYPAYDYFSSCTAALSKLIRVALRKNTFSVLHGQHSEPYPIIGAKHPVAIERFARSLFGIIARGAHLTVFTRTAGGGGGGMKIWVPRRSATLFTYPNRLDSTVAGGVTAREGPFECIVREAAEEASLPEEFVRENAHSCGVLSYVGLSDAGDGGERGLVSPDLIYVYDLEVGGDVVLTPGDEEVREFYLWDVEQVKDALARAEFKTNSALVMIDFLMRHGAITPENEKEYAEISARMHRRLPFPTARP
ncbi:MAG: hypothetical protein Q9191_008395 [Dirinaria sp. TL-2023a]